MKQLFLSITLLPVLFSSCDKHQVFPSEAKIEGISSIMSTQNNMGYGGWPLGMQLPAYYCPPYLYK